MLREGMLGYYLSQHDLGQPRWSISLHRAIVSKEPVETADSPFCFSVTDEHDRRYLFIAASAEERDQWVAAIDRAIASITYGNPSSVPAHRSALAEGLAESEEEEEEESAAEPGMELLHKGHLYLLDQVRSA